MNEWGTPDWQDAAAYGDVTGWTFNRWRWEFYRRRDDLRAYFDAHAEETYHHWQKFSGKPGFPAAHFRPHEPGFCAMVNEEALNAFSYPALPNPRIGEQPWDVIIPNESDGAGNIMEGPSGEYEAFRGTLGELLDFCDVKLNDEQRAMLGHALGSRPAPLEAGEMAVTFDLNKPIEPQVTHARKILRWHQGDIHGKRLQKRRHPARWLEYLRTLDAREAMPEASWQALTGALFSAGLVERHKDPAGGYCPPPHTAGRDKWNAADALRFNF